MLSELTIGRAAQANAIDSFHKLGYRGFKWVGVTGVAVAFIVTSYYCHVGGWVLRYVVSYITEAQTVYADPLGYFYGLLGYNAATGETWFPLTAILFAAVFMAVNAFIIIKGVEGGIEKFNKVGMPALFVILIVLARAHHHARRRAGRLRLYAQLRLEQGRLQHLPLRAGAGVLLPVAGHGHHDHLRLVSAQA